MPLEDLHSASAVIFNWDAKLVASAILIISYLILFTEKLNRAVVALVGRLHYDFCRRSDAGNRHCRHRL